jgi:hypothetical protein
MRWYLIHLADWPYWARGLLVIVLTVLLVIFLLMFLPDASGEIDERPRSSTTTTLIIMFDWTQFWILVAAIGGVGGLASGLLGKRT